MTSGLAVSNKGFGNGHKAAVGVWQGPAYLATSANNQVAATILFHLVLTLGARLCVCVEPVCCLTVITALPLPLLPPSKSQS